MEGTLTNEWQPVLFQVLGADVSLTDVPIDQCKHSRFNTRKSRKDSSVTRLAERMEKIGYERTRAVWAIQSGDGVYEVFAGGTRLDAARLAGFATIPVMLHIGLEDEEISRRADLDNENDEYHEVVSIVDVWAEYARLRDEEGWTQKRIAGAKGVSQPMVSYRLTLNDLPDSTKAFISQGLLTEGHLTEISQLSVDLYFSSWLTSEQAQIELVELVIKGKAKDGKIKSVNSIKKIIENWKKFIDLAQVTYDAFPEVVALYDLGGDRPVAFDYRARGAFVQGLADRKARSQVKVKEAKREVTLCIADNLKDYKIWIDIEESEAARKAVRARREKEALSKFVLGDCLEKASGLEDGSVRLLLTDPPYGQDYQSNRRWRTRAPPKIAGDKLDDALALFAEMLDRYLPKLATDAHVLVFCNARNEPGFRRLLDAQGLTFGGSLIWVKEEHSAGDLECSFGPSHERILHYVQGRPKVEPRHRDVLEYARDLSQSHPTAKPVPLLEQLILCCTNEGQLVVDPLAGVASMLIAAMRTDREFWGCEIENDWYDLGIERILEEVENEV